MADDNFDDADPGDAEGEDLTKPLLRFDTSGTADLPHWSEPATGELPVIDGDEPSEAAPSGAGGSRLFPQLPDDPNMVDSTEPEGFRSVGDPLPSSVEELFADRNPVPERPAADELEPTGPMSLDAASDLLGGPIGADDAGAEPDTTIIRGLGDDAPPAPGPALGFDGGQAASADADASVFGGLDDADDLLDDAGGLFDGDPSAVEGSPTGILEVVGDDRPAARFEQSMDDDFPKAPDTSALFDDEVAPSAAPLGADLGSVGDAAEQGDLVDPADEGLDAWANLDGPTPHWREGSQDYEERARVQDDERTVLHFDDGRGDEEIGGGGPGGGEMPPGGEAPAPVGGRNVPVAAAVGITLAVAFFGLLSFSSAAAMVMVVIALVLAASEFFQSVRNVGYRPAVLLGLAGTAGMALAAYWRGVEAYPVVVAIAVMAGLLWFLLGVETEHATANLAITMLGVGWVGVLGSFAALILRQPHGDAIILGAVIGTVAYDVGGYVIGSATGQSRIAPHISPNKTYEGLIGGMILSVVVTTVVLSQWPGIYPWDNMSEALWFGLAVAFAAPTGDLAQSLIKRDLGVKDMGSLLPGHGGVFDRFDALLFVLPAAYFVSDIFDIGIAP